SRPRVDPCAGSRTASSPKRARRTAGTEPSDSKAAPRSDRRVRPKPSPSSMPVLLPSQSMDLGFSATEEAFRDEVRAWLEANLPPEWRDRGIGDYREDEEEGVQREWQRRLHEAGWLKLAWPKEAGGRGASPVMQAIYQEEMARAGAPIILGRLGVTLLAPTLLVHGSPWQKEQYLEKLLSGELIFCQGFSEPDAGSDLAGLRARAEKKNGKWILNGQKTWSSGAHYADRSFLLARTSS